MRYILEDSTLRFKFNTRRFTTGAPFTLAGTPSLAVYPEDSATQITAGITLDDDYDGKTGLNDVVIDLSADAGYVADKAYTVVIEVGTVDSVSVVGSVVYEFFIVAAGGMEDLITRGLLALPAAAPGAAGGLIISNAGGLDADAQRADVGAILVDTAEIGAAGAGLTNINLPNQTMDITGNITGNLSGSVGSVTGDIGGLAAGAVTDIQDAVWDAVLADHLDVGSTGEALNAAGAAGDPWITALPGAYGAGTAGNRVGNFLTGDAFVRLGAPAGASVSADIAAIEAQTDDIGVAGVGLTAVPWNAAWDAEVQSEVADALTAFGAALEATSQSILTDTAEIGVAGAGLTAINLPDQTMNITGNLSGSVGSVTAAMAELTGDPGATPTLAQAQMLVYMAIRNARNTTSADDEICNNAGAVILTAALSDDTVTFVKGKYA